MVRLAFSIPVLFIGLSAASAGAVKSRAGWVVVDTRQSFQALVERLEAPIRIYVTENPDGTATLSYKKPSALFAPYADEGGDALKSVGAELDEIFAKIAERATSDK